MIWNNSVKKDGWKYQPIDAEALLKAKKKFVKVISTKRASTKY